MSIGVKVSSTFLIPKIVTLLFDVLPNQYVLHNYVFYVLMVFFQDFVN